MRSDRLPDGVPLEELVAIFVRCSDEAIAQIDAGVSGLRAPLSPAMREEAQERLHRLCHNMKGSALQFGYEPIAEIAREMETRIRECRSLGQCLDPDDLDALAHGAGRLRALLERAGRGEPLSATPEPGDPSTEPS